MATRTDVKTETLLELAERCEAATGPDHLLDDAIWETVDPERARGAALAAYYRRETFTPPAYTASIDAAMTLVPEGRDFTLDRITPSGPLAPCNASLERCSGNAATPALALCAAALRARAA